MGPDGCVYFATDGSKVLRVATDGVIDEVGPRISGVQKGVVGPDGCIYFTPFDPSDYKKNSRVLCVTTDGTVGEVGPPIQSGGWTPGVVGSDGCIYFASRTASTVLRVESGIA